jgi:hypothetical protein
MDTLVCISNSENDMTERQFTMLALGDEIVNKRSPGIVLRVVNRFIGESGLQIEVENSAGKHWISYLRHKEYQQAYPQLRMKL